MAKKGGIKSIKDVIKNKLQIVIIIKYKCLWKNLLVKTGKKRHRRTIKSSKNSFPNKNIWFPLKVISLNLHLTNQLWTAWKNSLTNDSRNNAIKKIFWTRLDKMAVTGKAQLTLSLFHQAKKISSKLFKLSVHPR